MEECQVCALSKKVVKCPNQECIEPICFDCSRKYIENELSELKSLKCMLCDANITFKWVCSNFSKKWLINVYLKIKSAKIFEREKGLLPKTQGIIIIQNQKKKEIEKILKQKQKLIRKIDITQRKIEILFDQVQTKKKLAKKIKHTKIKLDDNNNIVSSNRCPNGECRGFLTKDFVCVLCKADVCKDCETISNKNHVCDIEKLDSIKKIREETRECPNCLTKIYRIHGCDQMWCVICNIGFCWSTGVVLQESIIINPHFTDFKTEKFQQDKFFFGIDISTLSFDLHLILTNVKLLYDIQRPKFIVDTLKLKTVLRLKYLKNEINESEWISHLNEIIKDEELSMDVIQILDNFVFEVKELIKNHIFKKEDSEIIDSIHSLRENANKEFNKLSGVFNRKSFIIHKNMNFNQNKNKDIAKLKFDHLNKTKNLLLTEIDI